VKGMLCCLQSLFSSIKRVARVASHAAEAVVACARLVSLMGMLLGGGLQLGQRLASIPQIRAAATHDARTSRPSERERNTAPLYVGPEDLLQHIICT
jgi:hypothetical protein